MAWEVRQIILVIHILLATIWVGGVLFVGWGIFPVVTRTLKMPIQREFFLTLIRWTHWLFTTVGIGVILTGILLGTVMGPIRQYNDIWDTPFGNVWIAALMVALFILTWGALVGYRYSMKTFLNEKLWIRAALGDVKPLKQAYISIAMIESVEAVGFIVLINLMILL